MRRGIVSDNTTTTPDEALDYAAALLDSDPAAALERAHRLAADRPNPPALRLAAAALRALGRNEEAEMAELGAIRLGFPDELKRALATLHSGQADSAKAIADEYLRQNPDDLLAMTVAAQCAMACGETGAGEALTRDVLARAPAFPQAAILLANSLEAQVRLKEAIVVMDALRGRLPKDPIVLRYLADLHVLTGNPAEGAKLYAEAMSAQPGNAMDLFKYAQNLRAAGSREESVAALRRATETPVAGNAWWALAHYFPDELAEGDVPRIEAAIGRGGRGSAQEELLRIALSFIQDRRGEHENAFNTISALKAELRLKWPYDSDALTRHVDELIAAFTHEPFSSRRSEGSTSNAPIFIVGMPRSGSTLVERILGMHSQIEGIGEVQLMQRLVDARAGARLPGDRSLLPHSIAPGTGFEMAAWYLERSTEFRRTDKPRFIDKRNANWIHAGLIRLIFPEARIIDVRRGAVDCCWSMFKMLFGDQYANDQRDLARYYADYVRLIDAIGSASPGGILTVDYEDLVGDIEGETRRMLEFVALDYEPACIEFHLSTAAVATPSSEQVRREINADSIGTATPYLEYLGPLVNELKKLGVA